MIVLSVNSCFKNVPHSFYRLPLVRYCLYIENNKKFFIRRNASIGKRRETE